MFWFLVGILLLMNLCAFCLMGIDKFNAIHHNWRIPEATLFSFCVFGGAWGATLGMRVFHHKTKHPYFWYGFHAIMLIETVLLGMFLLIQLISPLLA